MEKELKPITLGFLIESFDSEYHLGLYNGICAGAEKLGVNLITFVGGLMEKVTSARYMNSSVYGLAGTDNVDGLIFSSGSLGFFTEPKVIGEFINGFQDLPKVSLSHVFEGVPSIYIDNAVGFRELMIHFLKEHNYRRIAFVKGVEGNRDASERFKVYLDALQEFGITPDPNWVVEGRFVRISGLKAVDILLDERKLRPDAIIAANDETAWGVLDALRRRGISVPESIAVGGFDNNSLSRYLMPHLTTVHQPVYDLGLRSVEILVDIISGKTFPMETCLNSKAIFRHSCGCHDSLPKEGEPPFPEKPVSRGSVLTEKVFKSLEGVVVSAVLAAGSFSGSMVEEIKQIYWSIGIAFLQKSHFTIPLLGRLDHTNSREMEHNLRLSLCVAEETRKRLLPLIRDIDELRQMENIFFTAMKELNGYWQALHGFSVLMVERDVQAFRYVSQDIIMIEEMEEISNILSRQFEYLGISFCSFAFFENRDNTAVRNSDARLIFVYDEERNVLDCSQVPTFKAGLLCPPDYLKKTVPHNFTVEPILYKEKLIGLALFEFSSRKNVIYNIILKMFISSMLKSTAFIQQAQTQAQKIEEANRELRIALENLTLAQKKLVQSERMAAVGNLVTGVAHEINTPLGVGITATSFLKERIQGLMSAYSDGRLKKTDLEDFVVQAGETVDMILSNLDRSQELIRIFKGLATDKILDSKQLFHLKSHIRQVLLCLDKGLKDKEVSMTLTGSEDLELEAYPDAFTQIVTHLVKNSLLHGFSGPGDWEIVIDFSVRNSELVFVYRDNGSGIPYEAQKKIFDPFFTTNRGAGAVGLGLHLVYNLVVSTLGGSIEYSSGRDCRGVEFVIVLPLFPSP